MSGWLGMWLAERLAALIPAAWLYRLARWAGALALPVAERRRLRVRANIQRLRPEWAPAQLDAAVRGVFQETACYYVDLALLPRRRPCALLEEQLTVEGLEFLEEARAAGRGVVLAGAHLSNPEVPFQALAALGIEALALVEPLPNRRLMAALQRRRQAAGLRFAPTTSEGLREAITLLRRGGVVAILSDRAVQGRGVCVPFAGRLARFPAGAVDLVLRTDATLLIGIAIRLHADRFRVLLRPTAPLLRSDDRGRDRRTNLANLMREMEPLITAHADQWRLFESPWRPCHDTSYLDPSGRARPAVRTKARGDG